MLKLRKLAFKIVHSTTILLPEWKKCLEDLKLSVRIMPCDVSTRWNSMHDMLLFAIKYRQAIDAMTKERKHGLRAYEMTDEEWVIVGHLHDTLKVC